MTQPLRVGAVGYLNARPLVEGLDRDPRFTVRFDLPSRCATLLHEREVDLGLLPSIEFLRGDYRIVPGIAVASEGAVHSVAVFSRRPLAEAQSMALDTSSCTSVALCRVLCDERFHIAPEFVPHAPDLDAMLEHCDAALLIGDPALWADRRARGLRKVDLGAEWTAHTGLPFVWACWVGRPGVINRADVAMLRAARDRGEAAVHSIASREAGPDPGRIAIAEEYLRRTIRFHLGDRHVEALQRFFASAARLGLVECEGRPAFYDE